MKELLDQLWQTRKKCKDYGTSLETKLGSAEDPRCACFANIFNKCTQNIELLDYYKGIWERPFVVKTPDRAQAEAIVKQLKEDNVERCMDQTKMLFIGVMSSIEFSAKQSVKLYSTKAIGKAISAVEARKRIYLNDIIQESFKLGLISDLEKSKWERLIWLRNLLVHNNGVAETDDVYTIDTVTITLNKDKMTIGRLDTFTNFVDSAVELYREWSNKL